MSEIQTVMTDNWHISLRFSKDVLILDLDPLSFLRKLRGLGEFVHVTTLYDNIPPLAEMDVESNYLGLEIQFKSAVDKAMIEAVFESVEDECVIHILPPRAKIDDYAEMIASLPEPEMDLAAILFDSGALTQQELVKVLVRQEEMSSTRETDLISMPSPILENMPVEKDILFEQATNKNDEDHIEPEEEIAHVDVTEELYTVPEEVADAGVYEDFGIEVEEKYTDVDMSEEHDSIPEQEVASLDVSEELDSVPEQEVADVDVSEELYTVPEERASDVVVEVSEELDVETEEEVAGVEVSEELDVETEEAVASVDVSEELDVETEEEVASVDVTEDLDVVPDEVDINTSGVQPLKADLDTKSAHHHWLRVDADKLDQLIDLVGELVIAGAATNLHSLGVADEGMTESMSVMNRLVNEIRDSTLHLRMVQIGDSFKGLNRLVRDLSKELGKEAKLEIVGEETELDKTMVEMIGDPLIHLVKNAIDHGIELPQVRLAAGKPSQGRLTLNTYRDSGNIVIEVSDDGQGINREQIFARAVEKNIIGEHAVLSDKEVFDVIFEPGFSTVSAVTNADRRGVGLDVVKRNIQALRGSVQIESLEGLGSTTQIRLPLSLAIIDGFMMGVNTSRFVIPLDTVVECIELDEEERHLSHKQNYINLRGEVLPFIRLHELFNISGGESVRQNIVVVQNGSHKAGFLVDELLGEFQTVIKPLGKVFKNLKVISGATILGNGEVAVVLDITNLVQKAKSLDISRSDYIDAEQENDVLTIH